MRKIKTSEKAYRIIIGTEALIKTGHHLKFEQECRYIFAKIFLDEIGKRRNKQSSEITY